MRVREVAFFLAAGFFFAVFFFGVVVLRALVRFTFFLAVGFFAVGFLAVFFLARELDAFFLARGLVAFVAVFFLAAGFFAGFFAFDPVGMCLSIFAKRTMRRRRIVKIVPTPAEIFSAGMVLKGPESVPSVAGLFT